MKMQRHKLAAGVVVEDYAAVEKFSRFYESAKIFVNGDPDLGKFLLHNKAA